MWQGLGSASRRRAGVEQRAHGLRCVPGCLVFETSAPRAIALLSARIAQMDSLQLKGNGIPQTLFSRTNVSQFGAPQYSFRLTGVRVDATSKRSLQRGFVIASFIFFFEVAFVPGLLQPAAVGIQSHDKTNFRTFSGRKRNDICRRLPLCTAVPLVQPLQPSKGRGQEPISRALFSAVPVQRWTAIQQMP